MIRLLIGLALASAMLLIALPGMQGQAGAQMLAFHSEGGGADTGGKSKRVQADLAREVESWQADTGCTSLIRAHSALKPVLARWLGAKTMAHPGRKLEGWGYHSGDIWTESRTVDGKRICSAGFRKLIAYAQFR